MVKCEGNPVTSKGRRGVTAFDAHHFSASWHCDGGAYLISVAVVPWPPPKEGSSFTTTTHVAGRVGQDTAGKDAASHAKMCKLCGLSMCAVAGLELWTLAWTSAKERSRRRRQTTQPRCRRTDKLWQTNYEVALFLFLWPDTTRSPRPGEVNGKGDYWHKLYFFHKKILFSVRLSVKFSAIGFCRSTKQ